MKCFKAAAVQTRDGGRGCRAQVDPSQLSAPAGGGSWPRSAETGKEESLRGAKGLGRTLALPGSHSSTSGPSHEAPLLTPCPQGPKHAHEAPTPHEAYTPHP